MSPFKLFFWSSETPHWQGLCCKVSYGSKAINQSWIYSKSRLHGVLFFQITRISVTLLPVSEKVLRAIYKWYISQSSYESHDTFARGIIRLKKWSFPGCHIFLKNSCLMSRNGFFLLPPHLVLVFFHRNIPSQ